MSFAHPEPTSDLMIRNESPDQFDAAFSVENFIGAIEIAANKIGGLLNDQSIRGVSLQRPQTLISAARTLMSGDEKKLFDPDRFSAIVDLYLRTGIQVNSRGYLARQFSSVVPVSAVFDLITAMAPQPASFYEAGQLANAVDKIMAEEFGRLIGWPAGSFDMVATSGTSLANLTAVLAARNRRLAGSWEHGVAFTKRKGRPAIAMGMDAHFSVTRLAGILGIGQNQIIRLPLNALRQICPDKAAATLRSAADCGLDVFCIVAAAGTTSIGANDPLAELADLARAHDAWLHVDAAHNGAFLVSDSLRPRLKGLELADSFCLDAHKMLFVPALCTLLFYRDKEVADTAFPQQASYVSEDRNDEISRFESGMKNFECTKRPSILNLWLVWALFGRRFFENKLNHLVAMTLSAHDYLTGLPDFKVMHRPESNILCFTYCPDGLPAFQRSRLQLALRNRIRAEGRYFISMVNLDGENVLRMVIMNHRIGLEDIAGLTDEIRCCAREILEEWNGTPSLSVACREDVSVKTADASC